MRALLLLLPLLSACAGDPPCRLEKLAELPVRIEGHLPVLAVQINGQPAAMILDTGSDGTVLTRAGARRLGIPIGAATATVNGAAGPETVGVGRLDSLALGGVVLPNVKAFLSDSPRPPIDGLIGIDVLVGYELELDLPHQRVALYRARSCVTAQPDWPAPYVQLPTQQQAGSGHLFVPVEVDGQGLRGLLDSGASASTLSLQSAEDAGMTRRRLATLPAIRSQTVNAAGLVLHLAHFHALRVGTDVVEEPVLAIGDLPPFAGDLLLGSDYLASRRVWFSFLLGRVFVQSAPAAVGRDTLVRDP